jgi:hypothetical protein
MITETKICLNCNRNIQGRTDKKFCNDFCRNTHHNRLNTPGSNYTRNINHRLLKNRRILESLLLPGRKIAKTSKQVLQHKGFSFHYFTHDHTNKKGNRFYFCYEYGYRLLEKEELIIMKRFEYGF